jgi:RNA polymerase sigma-70 factor, ECF subfamily
LEEFKLDKILVRARKLDQEAMAALCGHYYSKILKFMYYRTSVGNAEDLTGEVFLKVMRSISSQNGNFEAWIYRIARNVIIDRARYSKARPEVAITDENEKTMTTGRDGTEKIDAAMDIKYALAQVNDEQRELLSLKFIQGLSNDEISEITGKSTGAIRAMQFRALAALREVMKASKVGRRMAIPT